MGKTDVLRRLSAAYFRWKMQALSAAAAKYAIIFQQTATGKYNLRYVRP